MTAPRLTAGGIIAGKYTVRNILGNGGAVITYHCVNQQGQEVAVKLYDPAVASHATVMKSLEQAYAATNALPQGSAAPIIDAGYDQPTLAPFSVTELLRLPSLQSQQRRLPPEEVVGLLKGLARSLDLAHVRNVVHGAIKPTNVFSGPSCNPIVVTDFAANLPKAAVPTQEGFVNSAPWIAPEQAQSGSVTPAADVFAVGLLVFYALTGRTYWRSCQGAQFDLNGWQQELQSQRTPASQRAAELGVPLSPTLDMVIWKALSNDPADRYQSVGEFADVLDDSMRTSVGSAATMALPMVGDAPSPLPAGMRNPEGPRPAAGAPPPAAGLPPAPGGQQMHAGAATMALPLEAFVPGGIPPAPPPGGPGPGDRPQGGISMPTQAMSLDQLQAHQAAIMAQNGSGGERPQVGHNNLGATVLGNPPPIGAPMQGAYGSGMGGQGGYGVAAQGGYPPPPGATNVPPKGGPKIIPLVIAFTAVALLGLVGTLVFFRLRSDTTADDAPVNVDFSSKPTETAAPPTSEPAATTPPPDPTQSAAPAKQVEIKVVCKPVSCESVKVDGTAVDLKQPIKVDPGSRSIEVSRAGFVSQTEKVDVPADGTKPFEKTFSLVAEKQTPPPSTGTTPTTKPTNVTKKPPPCKKGGIIKC